MDDETERFRQVNINDQGFQAYLDDSIAQLNARVADAQAEHGDLDRYPDEQGAKEAARQLTKNRRNPNDQDIGWAWDIYRAQQPDATVAEKAVVQGLQSALELAPETLGTEGEEFFHYDLDAVLRLAALMDQPHYGERV